MNHFSSQFPKDSSCTARTVREEQWMHHCVWGRDTKPRLLVGLTPPSSRRSRSLNCVTWHFSDIHPKTFMWMPISDTWKVLCDAKRPGWWVMSSMRRIGLNNNNRSDSVSLLFWNYIFNKTGYSVKLCLHVCECPVVSSGTQGDLDLCDRA